MFKIINKKNYDRQFEEKLKIKEDEIIKLQNNISELTTMNNKYEKIIFQYDQSINKLLENIKKLDNELEKKEKSRRRSAGKNGYYQKELNKVRAEKQEMMKLIDNLINERQKNLNLKKKTELRKYFKKN